MQYLSSLNHTTQLGLLAEPQCLRRADIGASGLLSTFIKQVSAAGTFLGQVEDFVKVDSIVRTEVNAALASIALDGIDDD
jgi:hypothetical protein